MKEECSECGAFMVRVGEVRDSDPTGGEYWDTIYAFYQCPNCKTIRIVDET